MPVKIKPFLSLAALLALSACNPSPAPDSAAAQKEMSTNTASPARPRPEFEKLIGRWERPDGGYVLELRSVDEAGRLDAGYFNPSPIKIERAQAFIEGGVVKLVVVLRDENYPGCTYQLAYDANHDQLFGEYYQAALQETYEIAFTRQK